MMSDITAINGTEKVEADVNGTLEAQEESNAAPESKIMPPPNNTKILKKSISENLDILNKNVQPLNGNYEIGKEAPRTPGEKIYYDCDFLYSLRDSPIAQKKPEILFQKLARTTPGVLTTDGPKPANLLPQFARGGLPRGGGGTPSRRSQQGNKDSKDGGGRRSDRGGGRQSSSGNLGGKSSVIEITLSRDVKLNECENAWKPNKQRKDDTVVDAEIAVTEDIYKKIRSILNKLTPQNFKKMMTQVRELSINTQERLGGVINLVFEKAVDEPNFAETYALMCKELEQIKVKKTSSENNNSEEFISFRYLIISRCQQEFEKNKNEEKLSDTKSKEIEECADPEEKKTLQLALDEEERKSRVRSVGNVRFIGELFKQQYITSNIMISCIQSLLKKLEEETMECLCKLLTTIGKNLETNHKVDLQTYFTEMRKIAEDKNNKLNSRIRFMLKDIIELRLNNWTPRQKLSTPIRLEDIQLEADMERMNKSSYNKYTSSSTSQRDDRSYSGRGGGSKSFTSDDSGWSPVQSSKRVKQPFMNPSKLRNMNTGTSEVSLQPPSQSMWSRGSASGKKESQAPPTPKTGPQMRKISAPSTKTHNPFAALAESGDAGDPISEAFGSSNKSNDKVSDKPPAKPVAPSKPQVTLKTLSSAIASGDPYAELLDYLQLGLGKDELPALLKDLIILGLESNTSKTIRIIGKVTGTLVCKKLITTENFLDIFKQSIDNLQHIFDKGDEIWDSLSKLFWSHGAQNELTFAQLLAASSTIVKMNKGYEFLMSVFMEKIEDSNEKDLVKKLWQASDKMTLMDWMSQENAQEFMSTFSLDFISCGEKEEIHPDTMCAKLQDMMEKSVPMDAFDKWIQTNVGESVKELWFVRALTEALYTYVICAPQYQTPRFDKNSPRFNAYNQLLITYVTTQPKLQLECLYAIQNLMNKLEHPQCIALNLFESLWESDIISNDTFLAWEVDSTQQEGKGVMLKMLTSFFTALKADDSSDDTSPIEDDQSTLD